MENDIVEETLAAIGDAPITEPGPGEYVDECHYSRTGFAIWKADRSCTCRPANAPNVSNGERG